MARRAIFLTSAALLLALGGCLNVQPQPALPPTNFSSWSPMGGFSMSSGASCAGHTTLGDKPAVISDSCFTAADNVVLCTDTTTPAAIACTPTVGALTITGPAGDSIAYARVR